LEATEDPASSAIKSESIANQSSLTRLMRLMRLMRIVALRTLTAFFRSFFSLRALYAS
jgi:hypothetical protein